MEILIAFLVVLGVALVAGILLLIFSKLFLVEKNPVEKKIRECLPGVNCGACGYKGCDDYAAALAQGGVKPTLCIPGDQKVANQICEILGVEEQTVEDVVAFVNCNGHCDAVKKVADYEGVQTCSAASMLYGGTNSCHFGCLGFGDCAKVCPSGAICLIDGIAHVLTERCIGCGLCKQTCPKQVISMVPQETRVVVMCSNKQKGADAMKACKNACIGCKKCEKTCSYGAIKVTDNLARIDYTICKNCGECTEVCPTGCLKKVFFPDLPENSDFSDLVE